MTFDSPRLRFLRDSLKNHHSYLIEELWDSPKALVAAMAQETTEKNLVVIASAQEEASLYHDFPFFTDAEVIEFPSWETLPSENVAPSPDIVGDRYEVLDKIVNRKGPQIILTSLQACLQKVIPRDFYELLHIAIKKGDAYPFDHLIEQFVVMGYQRTPTASDKGEFAVRGGIIDIFPVSSPDPFRIEFWGDEIESLRIYDPVGQKSVKTIEQVTINPAKELELLDETPQLATLFDYLGKETIVVFDDLLALEDRYATLSSMAKASPHFTSMSELFETVEPLQKIYFTTTPIEELSRVKILEKQQKNLYSESVQEYPIEFEMFNRTLQAKRWFSPFQPIAGYLLANGSVDEGFSEEELFEGLKDPAREKETWRILCANEREKSAFETKLKEHRITLDANKTVEIGYLTQGLVMIDSLIVLFPLTEITHRYKIRRQKHRSTYHTPPTEAFQLQPGDSVVHLQHGIGRFLGMEKKKNHEGVEEEFFHLEYAKNSNLFVPLNQAHLITKYIGTTDEAPTLHEIGSKKWQRAREKTQVAIMGYAKDLLDLYAKRSMAKGFQYPPDSMDTEQFSEDFPFEETKDQQDAINAINQDMVSEKTMDRLICGDVGYGKTEVAMRAAFKAVVDGGKQVAVLVPTTVLAMQHYENFIERMRDYPLNVGVLSRFVTPKKARETLEGIKNGTVDILIGTHRIISKDVAFKDLGLVVIDEEQRFGVKAKEHLKKLQLGVDYLTLSATPIPRTLYLSLMGARDLSLINTPPQDRLPIKTIITDLNDNILRTALLRELARDGQAFVIHNRVESIYNMATRIKKLLPQARVIVGHGQMTPKEIDLVFHAFKNGEADILVATSIVENGIDIPNANTILVDRADRFGLAELYQLRGRVGRWNRLAYAYFLVPNLNVMPEITRKRLHAMAESSGYGGGMKIALRDLEIRGAGNVLGTEQSGQVEAIGFHQYCKWLKRAVQTLQGKLSPQLIDSKVEYKVDARLPEDYINEVSLRMEFYQRLGEALTLDEVKEIEEEMIDRFGPVPLPAKWLLAITRVKVSATQKGIHTVKVGKVSVTLEFKKGKKTDERKCLFQAPDTPREWTEALIKLLSGS